MTIDREQKIDRREQCFRNSEESYFTVYNYTHKLIFKCKDGMKIFSSKQTSVNPLSGSSWKVYFCKRKEGENGEREAWDSGSTGSSTGE